MTGPLRIMAIAPRLSVSDPTDDHAVDRAKLQAEPLQIVAKTQSTVIMVTHGVDEAVLLSAR